QFSQLSSSRRTALATAFHTRLPCERTERSTKNTLWGKRSNVSRHRERESRLAAPSDARQGEKPRASEQGTDLRDPAFPPDECRSLHRQVLMEPLERAVTSARSASGSRSTRARLSGRTRRGNPCSIGTGVACTISVNGVAP